MKSRRKKIHVHIQRTKMGLMTHKSGTFMGPMTKNRSYLISITPGHITYPIWQFYHYNNPLTLSNLT